MDHIFPQHLKKIKNARMQGDILFWVLFAGFFFFLILQETRVTSLLRTAELVWLLPIPTQNDVRTQVIQFGFATLGFNTAKNFTG